MDALCSSSIFLSKLPQTANNPVLAQPQFPLNYNPFGSSTINQSFNLSLCVSSSHTHGVRLSGSMIRAVSKDDLGECNDEPLSGSHYATAHPSLSQDIIATPDIIDKASSSPKNTSTEALGDASKIVTPKSAVTGSGPGGGSRAGLWRTPSSGGVQSATSAHGLPTPALAVRNMLEQARFAHLCTVMSRMHHRRQGYPFGTLVDFAPDSMGRFMHTWVERVLKCKSDYFWRCLPPSKRSTGMGSSAVYKKTSARAFSTVGKLLLF